MARFTPDVLDIILSHLAALFVTASDATAARLAASRMLAAYAAETEEELGLAADIISFALHALQALSQAADPELSLTKILRLRGSAVSLSRESHKARRKLDQLQRIRRASAGLPADTRPSSLAAQPEPPTPQPQSAAPTREDTASPPAAPAPTTEAAALRSDPPASMPEAAALRSEALAIKSEACLAKPPADDAAGPTGSATPIKSAGNANGLTWTQSYRQRQTSKRLAKKALKAQARIATQTRFGDGTGATPATS